MRGAPQATAVLVHMGDEIAKLWDCGGKIQ
jgi:hypothetical protein